MWYRFSKTRKEKSTKIAKATKVLAPRYSALEQAENDSIDQTAFADALDAVRQKNRVVLITGRAGTGKTTFIRQLMKDEKTLQVVVAPTGIAALNAKGQTIHSFFQIPPYLQSLDEIQPVTGVMKAKVIQKLQRLIIDEISMVRADLLDKIDRALQVNRKDRRAFGGVQIVMVGDFFQLPPVTRRNEIEVLEAAGYTDFSALGAKSLRTAEVRMVELETIFRQTEPEFINLLGNIRSGQHLKGTLEYINDHFVREHRGGHTPVLLTGDNAAADGYNQKRLAALPGQGVTFDGSISGDYKVSGGTEGADDKLPAPLQLVLKPGARVMMLKNDSEKRWVNGSLGTVDRITNDGVFVKIDGFSHAFEIAPAVWEQYKYTWNDAAEAIENKRVGAYSQLPMKLAWASTIHKAQGLSLADVRIDMGRGAFERGQAYVALSRATTAAGLSLVRPLTPADIMVDGQMPQQLALLRQQQRA